MRLHVLGRSAGWPGPGGACSGYLVEADGQRVLLDCGPGVLGRLQTICALEELDAVWVSHPHADHYLDLIPLAYGLMGSCLAGQAGYPLRQVPVLLPAGSLDTLAAVSRAMGHQQFVFPPVPDAAPVYEELRQRLAETPDFVFAVLTCAEYELDGAFRIGAARCRTRAVSHRGAAAAIRVEADGAALVYSGDSAFCPQLVELAQAADLLLCEATNTPASARFFPFHMSPREAGRTAAEAGVGQLVLTHVSPWLDEARALDDARSVFGGEVRLAREGGRVEVAARAVDGR